MKNATKDNSTLVSELCRKLKAQLDELAVVVDQTAPFEEENRRHKLLEQLKQQLRELSR